MLASSISTRRLKLVSNTPDEARAQVQSMSPADRAQLSAAWLALLHKTTTVDPWVLGFSLVDRADDTVIGTCGFKGPPDANGIVEIAYGVAPQYENKGYATEAAMALVQFAFDNRHVRIVRAHTIADGNASARVLTKCGFNRVGQVVDPEDGLVWRWEIAADG
jgi:RimJ/RimL family protein N-acetyltransferase